jgi:DNA-directed RNA polymerase subunit RPC12/RpoP
VATAALPSGSAGPLRLVLSCPKCGGPVTVDDETASDACEHCGSLLLLSAPERDEIYFSDDQLRSPEAVLETVIRYRVGGQRAEILGLTGKSDEKPAPEHWVQMRLEAFEKTLRSQARILDAHRVYVPYWHVTGWIVQALLGRRSDGPKIVRLRAFAVEHTVPAYDTRRANLRDRGLRLSRSRVHPLTVREMQERKAFVPWTPVEERSYREIERWRGQDLDPGLQPVARHASFLDRGRVLVYRPYWLARVALDLDDEQWILADGGFATLAGHPDAEEGRALVALAAGDPLRSGEPSFRRVHVVASRCPECGFEKALPAGNHVTICSNCHRALTPTPDGPRVMAYGHCGRGRETLDGDYLPFWRYRFRIEMKAAAPAERLEDYGRLLFPDRAPPGFRPTGEHLWVPAFRLLGTEAGDETFKDIVEWIHGAGLQATGDKIPIGGRPVTWGATLSEPEARELLPFVLMGLHGKASAARLNTLLVQRAVSQARLTPSEPELVMVPFDASGDGLVVGGTTVRVPNLLLAGGPELEAQRATVYGARVILSAT